MADLDDFFAKRDKKKKAGKNKKFDTAEDLAKILGKKVEERKKMEEGKSQYVPDNDGLPPPAQVNEDDEWIDAEEKEPDLTGLKIQELILDSEDEEERKEQEVGEGGETTSGEGVWGRKKVDKNVAAAQAVDGNLQQQQSSTTNNAEDSDSSTSKSVDIAAGGEPVDKKTAAGESANPSLPSETSTASSEETPAGPAKFVPPHLRNRPPGAASSAANPPPPSSRLESSAPASSGGNVKGAYVPPGRRGGPSSAASVAPKPKKSTAAPSINDEESFPSLGGS